MTTQSQARVTFGKRGASQKISQKAVHPVRAKAEPRKSQAGFIDNLFKGEIDETPAVEVKQHVLWSYFKACVAAFAIAITISSFFYESNAPSAFASRFFINLAGGFAMLPFAIIFLIPIRILADVAKFLRIPRGVSDVFIGGFCGSITLLPDIVDGEPLRKLSLCFAASGFIAGFLFWRSRGYPGLARKNVGAAEAVNTLIDRGSDMI